MNSIVVHYNELALKGRNRPWFVQMLVRNIRTALGGLRIPAVRSVMGRIEIELGPADWSDVRERLRTVFGIAYYSMAGSAPLELDAMAETILRDLDGQQPASFRVAARRTDKRYPLTSPQIEYEVGGRIKDATAWRVDLEHPALTVLVHFHSYPILSRASQEKVRELAALLTRYQQRTRLILVPFGDVQQNVLLTIAPELRVVMYRRLMMRIAEKLARRWHARALVTGEVIGQVASQTLDNLTTIGQATNLQVLRPLVGMDKDESQLKQNGLGRFRFPSSPIRTAARCSRRNTRR